MTDDHDQRAHDDQPDEHEHDHEHHHHDGPHDYGSAIAGYRAEKDAVFKSAPGSPIPLDERDAIDTLKPRPYNCSTTRSTMTSCSRA